MVATTVTPHTHSNNRTAAAQRCFDRPLILHDTQCLPPLPADLRANATRHAAAAASGGSPSGGGTLTQQELVRRLRDTQALLIKFSEENSRLSQDNHLLQAGRKALGVEHASVLDEIGE